ncbi:DUF1800 family protein [Aquabacterium sp.]|uniref:DUF1800 domain-containing protein n=1 Tax=Aquabacterium sp. TaxID=1872578 RepID=UPI003785294B
MLNRRLLLTGTAAAALALHRLPVHAARHDSPLSAEARAAHLLNRLGYGPRPGDIATVAQDPEAWIAQQLQPTRLPLPEALAQKLRDEPMLAGGDPIAALRDYLVLLQRNRQEARAAASPAAMAASATVPEPERGPIVELLRNHQGPALASRLYRALESPRQLEEVMVDFWFNHFNVYQNKNWMRVLVGAYEHQAIRPHALGRFRDLLGATAHHPAMLYYLDNWQSAGGRAAGARGLNENYARELMELHTLGVDGGYTQQDVTQLARMLTGWTIVPPRVRDGLVEPGAASGTAPGRGDAMPGFWFNARLHDRGDKLWLGRSVSGAGQAEGEQALDVLAAHPATARHIATRLATYFVSDQPPPALVNQLARVFQAEDGQIVPVLRTLFASDAFWSADAVGAKFKTPYHYALSALRAGGYTLTALRPLAGTLAAQGMPLYGCQTPDGYKNTESAWLNPDGMSKRINFATQLAMGRLANETLGGGLEAEALLQHLGPLVTPATRTLADRHQQDPVLAAALVLAGPGMMRR